MNKIKLERKDLKTIVYNLIAEVGLLRVRFDRLERIVSELNENNEKDN